VDTLPTSEFRKQFTRMTERAAVARGVVGTLACNVPVVTPEPARSIYRDVRRSARRRPGMTKLEDRIRAQHRQAPAPVPPVKPKDDFGPHRAEGLA
jgi:hypothetical protein